MAEAKRGRAVHCVEEGKTGVERPEEELEETNFVASTTMATTLIESSGNSVEEMEQASVTTTSNSPLLHRASSFLSSSYKLASKGYQLAKSATEAVMDAARRTSDTASAIREYSMSRQPKQALLENMEDPVTLEQLQLLRHYVRYCSASYGKLAVGFMARSMSRMIADKEGHKFQNFVSQYTGLQETDVIHVDAKGGLHRPVHYVAVDQAMGAIVVVLRGSMSISDVLTDLNCKPDQFIFRGQHYQVHRGILRSARELDIEIRPLVLSLREDNPGFKTVVVGHSLGAGVGTLLTAIWCSEQVTTVVVGDDVIPRLSLASMHALRKKVVSTFDKDATTKKQDITLQASPSFSRFVTVILSKHQPRSSSYPNCGWANSRGRNRGGDKSSKQFTNREEAAGFQ
eukprot:jgi/Bigna1/136467/aug1.34_g11175